MKDASRLYLCALCKVQVTICRQCDRGNIYCRDCAAPARKNSMREAGVRYQTSKQGRMKHAARQMRYRKRQMKKVTHQGSPSTKLFLSLKKVAHSVSVKSKCINQPHHCHHCNREVGKFLRQGFLSTVKKKRIGLIGVYALGP